MSIGIGIVGVRGYGRNYPAAVASSGLGTVRAVCDLDLAAATEFARQHGVPRAYGDLEALLADADVQAILLATPHHLHHAQALAALQAGRHVLCEKPLAIRGDHAWELAACARARKLVLSCHYNQRQSPVIKSMRRLVADGVLGRVYHAEARWMARWTGFLVDPRTSWRVRPEHAGGGILIGRGSHLIDAMLHVLGQPEVVAVEATTSARLTPHAIDDGATATIHLAGGSTLAIACTYLAHLAGRPEEMSYELFGEQGGAAWRSAKGVVAHGTAGRCDLATGAWTELSPCPAPDAATLEPQSIIADFLGAVATGRDPCVTGEQAARVVDLVSTAYRAAAEGRRLPVSRGPSGGV